MFVTSTHILYSVFARFINVVISLYYFSCPTFFYIIYFACLSDILFSLSLLLFVFCVVFSQYFRFSVSIYICLFVVNLLFLSLHKCRPVHRFISFQYSFRRCLLGHITGVRLLPFSISQVRNHLHHLADVYNFSK